MPVEVVAVAEATAVQLGSDAVAGSTRTLHRLLRARRRVLLLLLMLMPAATAAAAVVEHSGFHFYFVAPVWFVWSTVRRETDVVRSEANIVLTIINRNSGTHTHTHTARAAQASVGSRNIFVLSAVAGALSLSAATNR